jgi:hypothetical protein
VVCVAVLVAVLTAGELLLAAVWPVCATAVVTVWFCGAGGVAGVLTACGDDVGAGALTGCGLDAGGVLTFCGVGGAGATADSAVAAAVFVTAEPAKPGAPPRLDARLFAAAPGVARHSADRSTIAATGVALLAHCRESVSLCDT